MTSETLDKASLFSSLDEAASQLHELMAPLDESKLNVIPYPGSWTAGMLYRHVTKVIDNITRALQKPSKPAERDADEKVSELKKTFLDFSTKMKSPDIAIPEEGVYQKQDVLDKLQVSVSRFKEAAANQDGNELVTGLPVGDVTKLELLHFVLYHTQRHLNQMRKIVDALRNKQVPAA